jgi:hypothetical protein
LESSLNKNLFGQPLVTTTLINALKGHFSIKEPKKALVLSFHGSTGVGKNFVSQFIGKLIDLIAFFFFNFLIFIYFKAESLFLKGIKSKYFKQFISTRDFPHNEKLTEYKV